MYTTNYYDTLPFVESVGAYYDAETGTYVLPMADAPGYFYEWVEPIGDWVVKYKPIAGFYSPPIFDKTLSWYQIAVPSEVAIGSLKGSGALHFEDPIVALPFKDTAGGWYQHWSGATYVYYREDIHKIEIWSADLHKSIVRIVGWLESCKKIVNHTPKRTLKNFWQKNYKEKK